MVKIFHPEYSQLEMRVFLILSMTLNYPTFCFYLIQLSLSNLKFILQRVVPFARLELILELNLLQQPLPKLSLDQVVPNLPDI